MLRKLLLIFHRRKLGGQKSTRLIFLFRCFWHSGEGDFVFFQKTMAPYEKMPDYFKI